jgi:hypothetical protein
VTRPARVAAEERTGALRQREVAIEERASALEQLSFIGV